MHLLQAHALLLAVVLPPAIRVAGHWLPEEPLMVAMGALASRLDPSRAFLLLALLWLSHSATDHAVFSLGGALWRRLDRWPRLAAKVKPVAARLNASPWALAGLIPARVLPIGRAAWLAGCGGVGIPRARFAFADALAVSANLGVWCGIGWILGDRPFVTRDLLLPVTLWSLAACALAVLAVSAWRHRTALARLPVRIPHRRPSL
jgi:membrane protein DedA with SNARE-associated domain